MGWNTARETDPVQGPDSVNQGGERAWCRGLSGRRQQERANLHAAERPEPRRTPAEGVCLGNAVPVGAWSAQLVALEERPVVLIHHVREIPSREALAARGALPQPPAGAGLRVDERRNAPRPRTRLAAHPSAGPSVVDEPRQAGNAISLLIGDRLVGGHDHAAERCPWAAGRTEARHSAQHAIECLQPLPLLWWSGQEHPQLSGSTT